MPKKTISYSSADDSERIPGVVYPEDSVPPIRSVFLGVQHLIAMFGATVLGPLLMGFNPNTAILFSGIATLIFYVFVKGKIPSYLGSSFSFIAAVVAATGYSGSGANPNIAVALGGIIAAGALYFLIGATVKAVGYRWLERLMPPVVTGAIVAIIGRFCCRSRLAISLPCPQLWRVAFCLGL